MRVAVEVSLPPGGKDDRGSRRSGGRAWHLNAAAIAGDAQGPTRDTTEACKGRDKDGRTT